VYSRAIRFAPCPAYRMTSLSKLGLAACIGAAAFAGSLFAATADAPWPSRPVRIIVAQAPGGPPDLISRYVAEKLSRNLGAPVIVDNRPGASGIIGIDQAAHATPDGHTLVIATLSTHALVPHVAASVPYDPLRDFVPVSTCFARSRRSGSARRSRRRPFPNSSPTPPRGRVSSTSAAAASARRITSMPSSSSLRPESTSRTSLITLRAPPSLPWRAATCR